MSDKKSSSYDLRNRFSFRFSALNHLVGNTTLVIWTVEIQKNMGGIIKPMFLLGVLTHQLQQSWGNGINFVLGGSWFEDSSVGQEGGYLKTQYKNQVLDPIIERVANHVYNNHNNLGIHFWVLMGFGCWLGGLTAYVIFKGNICRPGVNIEPQILRKGVFERMSIKYPRNDNNNNQQSVQSNSTFNAN